METIQISPLIKGDDLRKADPTYQQYFDAVSALYTDAKTNDHTSRI